MTCSVGRVNVAEENTNISLVIERGRGQFGHVSVFCFAQSSSYGAKRGEDFNFEPRVGGQARYDTHLVLPVFNIVHLATMISIARFRSTYFFAKNLR